jgi:alkylated DNA repair dioxygenase AlkB
MISGLTYETKSLTSNSAQQFIFQIDEQPWRTDLKRRVQHYGYVYDYKRRTVDKSMFLGKLPDWSEPLTEILVNHPDFAIRPDQMIINEYEPGQGIAYHIDCEPCFGDVIASFSLNSTCIMNFVHAKNSNKQELLLEPNSLLIIRGEARYDWKHGILARKTDKYGGTTYPRKRRISITFRKVILNT